VNEDAGAAGGDASASAAAAAPAQSTATALGFVMAFPCKLAHARPMRAATVLLCGLLSFACARGGPSASSPSTTRATIERAADSGQVDRVGAADGALSPDGNMDLSFHCIVDGPVTALFLVTVDEAGTPTGAFQADTLTGAAESPRELGARSGAGTVGLGVAMGNRLLNAPDGSLPPLGEGTHDLVVSYRPATRSRWARGSASSSSAPTRVSSPAAWS